MGKRRARTAAETTLAHGNLVLSLYLWTFITFTPLCVTSAVMLDRYYYVMRDDATTAALTIANCALLSAVVFTLIVGLVVMCFSSFMPTGRSDKLWFVYMYILIPLLMAAAICADIVSQRVGTEPHDPNQPRYSPPELPAPINIPWAPLPDQYYKWTTANAVVSSVVVFGGMVVGLIPLCCNRHCGEIEETGPLPEYDGPFPSYTPALPSLTPGQKEAIIEFVKGM
jgi:hypothetical protein